MNIMVWLGIALVASLILRTFRNALSSHVPPPRIKLVPLATEGAHRNEVNARGRELKARGFQRIGAFRVQPMRGVQLTAFTHPGESLCAIVYSHPVAGCFVDVVCKSESGRAFTATTAPKGKELDQRKGHEKVFDTTLTIPAMVDLVLRRRPVGPWQTWNAGNFATKFEAAYAEEMDWRAGRGGVTSDEVRRHAEASGRKFSQGEIQKATHKLQREYAASRRDVR